MRIDPQVPALDTSATNLVTDARTGAAANAAAQVAGVPNDTVQLSGNQVTLSRLVAQLATLPDVRQERIDALRSAIQSGQFNPSNDEVAGAIVNELAGPTSNG